MLRRIICTVVSLILTMRFLSAQSVSPVNPVKAETAPVIDGILDETVWNSSAGISGFRTFIPDYGKEMPFNTIVWLSYDEENLYFAFRCFDDEPDKIKVSVDARDKIRQDDWVCVNLDSYNDHQTLYCIYANANGIQMDTRYAAGKEDLGMDLVFYSAGKVDDKGYTVEIRLPLKSIRFSSKDPVMMAATFERHISRLSTQGTFPPLDPDQGMAFLTQMQPIKYGGVKHYTLFEAIPALTYSYKGVEEQGKMTVAENKPDAGITLKYGITSQLILDAAVNPDFSQVEADAGQVDANLRYQLFYPEKRPFFQEGNENFQLAALTEDNPVITAVHTRNIADPVVGTKLSGKIGPRNTISLMYAADRIAEYDTVYGKYAHFPVLRYKRSLKDDSYFGVVGTAVEKGISSNYVSGADGQLRLNKSTIFEFNGLLSFTNDTVSGIEHKSGNAFNLYLHSETRNLDYSLSAGNVSEYFISQTGFVNRTGLTTFSGGLVPRIYPESKVFRRFDIGMFTSQSHDIIYGMWETNNSLSLASLLGGTFRVNLRMSYSTEIYINQRFNTSGYLLNFSGRLGTKLNMTFNYRNRQTPIYSTLEQGYGSTFLANIRYLPTEKLHSELTLTYQTLYRESNNSKVYDYLIARGRLTWQLNRYLFFRGIVEYNDYRQSLVTDFLASFTYIPGTVFHAGYGSLFEQKEWDGSDYIASEKMMEMKRGFFMKISYLFRV